MQSLVSLGVIYNILSLWMALRVYHTNTVTEARSRKEQNFEMVLTINAFQIQKRLGSVETNNLAERFNLNTEVFIYGMSSRSIHTVRSFRINNCHCVIVISIFL